DLVVGPLDADDGRAVAQGVFDLGRLEIGRDEDEGAQPGGSRGRGGGPSQVAGRGAGERVEAELDSTGRGDRDDAVLEAERRVAGVVLEVERRAGAQAQLSGEALSSDERGRPDGEAALRSAFDGEQLQVAPDSRRPPCDRIAGEGGASDVVVVLDLERSETGRTDEARAERLRPAAGATAQAADVGSPLGQRVGRCGIRRGSRFGGRRGLHWSDRCLEGHVDRRLRLRRSIAGAPGNRETLPGGRAWEGSLISQEDL